MTGKNPTILVLRLEGPMQAWGLRARWEVRDTGTEPSKSGIVGLLGCALGYKRGDARLEKELDALLTIAVREELPGIKAVDFQTITGDHPKAGGGSFKGKTILSPRAYLLDASFVVFIQGPPALLEKCKDALVEPKWPLYLGRKCCIPSRPLFQALTNDYESLDDAVANHPWETHLDLVDWKHVKRDRPEKLRCVIEDPDGNLVRDDAFRVNPARIYGRRRAREIQVEHPGGAN